MIQMIRTLGNIAAVLGMAACLVSGVARLANTYFMAGVSTPTIFMLGVGLMVAGCLAKLHVLTSGSVAK